MKTLTTYESADGCRFDDQTKCRDYETLCECVADAMSGLPPHRDDTKDCQYVQHTKEACLEVKRRLLAITKRLFAWCPEAFNRPDDEIHPRSLVGRIVDDSDIKCLNRAWSRLGWINWDNYREYEQWYFAMHPDEATEEIPAS